MKLTQTRRAWAQARKAPVLKAAPLAYPHATMSRYRDSLQRLVHTMVEDYRRQLHRTWRQNGPLTLDASLASQARITLAYLGKKWQKIYTERSRVLAGRMVESVSKTSASMVGQSLKELSGGLTLKVTKMPADLEDSVKASIASNVSLIRSIQAQFAQRVESTVMTAIQMGGKGTAQVFEDLQKIEGITDRRAKIIADDQVRKVTSSMNSARMQAAGVQEFRWIHSGGGADPRELHLELDGQIFRYDDPPVIDEKTGERGMPGQLVNCRCVAQPIVRFVGEEES